MRQELLKKDLVDLYIYAQGQSEIPSEMHKWAFYSLLAACVRDKVYFRKFADSKLLPNLYVLFIAPSAIGKGAAINPVNKLAMIGGLESLNARRVKLTAAALVDIISRRPSPESEFEPAKVYLLTPELSNSIGAGQQAKDLIRMMTDLYDASEFTVEEITRTNKGHKLPKPVINWIGGTTREWLMQSLDMESVLSGFTARTICLQVDYESILDKKFIRPIYPSDRDEVLRFIEHRLRSIVRLKGEFKMTFQAAEVEKSWYMSRTPPGVDDPKMPIWKREHDMVLKISMNRALAGRYWDKKLITGENFSSAVKEVDTVNSQIEMLINFATTSPQAAVVDRARNILRAASKIPHSAMLRKLKVRAEEFTEVLNTLTQTREIEMEFSDRLRENIYVWIDQEHEIDAEAM